MPPRPATGVGGPSVSSSSPTPNPRKRPQNTTSTVAAGPDRKRARIILSRTIVAQTDLPELKAGQLNVAAFVKSRKFEINALQNSMATLKASLKQRAFQSLPRDLRRRTASHNAKRVPKRIRGRAIKEMAEDNTPTHTFRRRKKSGHDRLRAETAEKLRKMGKKKEVVERFMQKEEEGPGGELKRPPRAHSRWRKRQKEKVWLPTHVWHAKRAHMSIKWGFSIPENPNDKCFRSTHRAAEKRGGIAWDTSYWSHILVRGEEEMVEGVLGAVIKDAAGDKKVKTGRRSKECWAYRCGGYPEKPIAPVTIIWSPAEEGKGRRVLVRVHPSGFYQVWEELLSAVGAHNLAAGFQKVFIDDLRFELGSIQIAGPSATDALISVLTPADPKGETEKVWAGLRGLTNSAALPPDIAFGFEVSDPRLRFPPRLEASTLSPEEQQTHLFTLQSTWPVPPRPHALLNHKKRAVSIKLQPSMKRIQKRKAAAPPGQFPETIPQDPKIPIIVVSSPLAGNKSTTPNKAPGSWTIILPWKWMQAVWHALMNTKEDIRFGGMMQQRQMAFDHGLPWFPADFPGTAAGEAWEEEQTAVRKEKWEKKPRQKRLNYDAVKIAEKKGEVGDWSRCDWKLLMTLETDTITAPSGMDVDNIPTTSSLLAPTETPLTESTATTEPQKAERKYWQIPSHLVTVYMRTHPALPPSLQEVSPSVLRNGIFAVKITLVHRGAPSDTARIYKLPEDDVAWLQLNAAITKGKGRGRVEKREVGLVEAGSDTYPKCPGEEDLVGFVTTGNYSLSEGRPVGLGGIVWGAWFCSEGDVKGRKEERWCIIRGVGETVGRLARWEAV